MSGWNLIGEKKPPNELVEVIDNEGNIAQAYPTYYPFKVGENKTGIKWGSEVIPCNKYWDGGWLIAAKGLASNIKSNIIKWRHISN